MTLSDQPSYSCHRLLGITGEGMESSTTMSLKMIDSQRDNLQKIVTAMEKRFIPLKRQKEDLELVLTSVNDWILVFHETERWNSGVPILRSARENCDDLITPYLNEAESEFNQAVFRLDSADIPCFAHVQKLLKLLRHEIRVVFEKESTFNGKFIEDVRVILGKITGIITAILALYYQ